MYASPLTELGGLKTWDRSSKHLDRSASISFFPSYLLLRIQKRLKTTDLPRTTLSLFGFWRGGIDHTRTYHICILRVLCLRFSVFALARIWFCVLMCIYYACLIRKLCWRWGCGVSHERNDETNDKMTLFCLLFRIRLPRVYDAADTGDSYGSVGHLPSAHQRRTCGPAATPCSNKCFRFFSRFVVFLLVLALSCYWLSSWLNNWGRA